MAEFYGGKDRNSLSNQVYLHLRDAILNGTYQAGDSLVETKLAEELGVSRTPIREALRQLELEELVTAVPSRGAVVQGISPQDVDDIFVIRLLIEGQAARWAALRMGEADLKRLRETVELMDFYTVRKDYRRLAELDTEFHDLIYAGSQSRVLRHTLTSLHHHISMARLSSLQSNSRATATLDEHRAILNALEQKNADLAAELMERHVSHATTNYNTQQHNNA